MEPFKEKTESELLDELSVKKTIKDNLNKTKKPVKFTWEGLKNLSLFFETNPFDRLKVDRLKELQEGNKAQEKDYIDFFEDIEKGLYGGVQDLGYSIGDLLTTGIDLGASVAGKETELTEKLSEVYEENKLKDPETLMGAITKVGIQYGVPGGAIFKVGNRLKKIGSTARARKTAQAAGIMAKGSQIAKRAGYMATAIAATDFIASSPEQETLFIKKEKEEGLSGSDLALARFRNRLRFGAEGALIGGGFTLMGKPMAIGLKYGLFKPGAKIAGLGLRAADAAVVRPASYLLSRVPGQRVAVEKLGDVGKWTMDKVLATVTTGNPRRQLPEFEKWRLFSTQDADPLKRRLKKLDNFFSNFRSLGKMTGKQFELTSGAKREIKARARTIEKYLESIEKKSYDLAKSFENLHNTNKTSPASKDYYLDQTLAYLKNQIKLSDLPKELQSTAKLLNNELIATKKTFGDLLPDGELKNYILDNVKSYMRKSFAVFTNPEYMPDKKIFDGATKYISENVIKKNKDLREEALKTFSGTEKQKIDSFSEILVKKILQAGKQDNADPLSILQRIAKNDLRMDKLLKTGEELPDAIKKLLGEEDNLKASVLTTSSHAITQIVNKQTFDKLAQLGVKEGWLFKDRATGLAKGILNMSEQKVGELPGIGLLKSDMSKLYASRDMMQALKGTPGTLDNWLQNSIYRNIMQLKVATQFGKTVLSPATQVRNVSSASMFPLANGHIGGRASVTESLKMVVDDIFGAGKVIDEEAFVKNIEKKIRLGVLDENIVASELQAVLQDIKNVKGVTNMDSLIRKLSNGKFMKGATRVYAGGDNLWKWYGHEYVKSQYKGVINSLKDVDDYYKNIIGRRFSRVDTFTGKVKTLDDAIEEIAAWEIRNTYPTYSKVPEFVKNIRKLPFGNFVSFPAEMIRSTYNILAVGAKQAMSKDPKIRQIGYRRLIGASVVLGGADQAVSKIAQNLTGVQMEQIEAYKRSLSAPWNSRATIIPINKWKDGVGKAINFSYFSPYDVVREPVGALLKTIEEGKMKQQDVDDILLNIALGPDGPIRKLTDPFISQSIALERISDVLPREIFLGGRGGETKTGGMVYSPTDDIGTKIQKSFIHVLRGLEPGAITTGRKIVQGAQEDISKGGVPVNLRDEMLALMSGIRIINVDVPRTMQYKITDYNKRFKSVTTTEKLFSLQDFQQRGPNVILDEFRDIQDETFRVNQDFYFVLKDAQATGVSEKELKKILRKRGLSTRTVNKLLQGKNIPYTAYVNRMRNRVKEAEKIAKDRGEKVNKDYFFPRKGMKQIEREYRDKSLEPEKQIDTSAVDSIQDLVGQRPTQPATGTTDQVSQRIQTPPLPQTPAPRVAATTQQINPNTGLTQTQEALLSPSEQIIARRT